MPSEASASEFVRHSMREIALIAFRDALALATVEAAFARHVRYENGALRICEDLYPLGSSERVSIVSIGKAAHSMLDALVSQIGENYGGIVVASVEPSHQHHNFRYFLGGHPTPTAESLRAGRAIRGYLEHQTQNSLVIYLLSGGGSAMVELPVSDDITTEDLAQTYQALVHSGAPIAQINAIRKHLSAIKGGRLAQAAYPAQQVSIMVSDVPERALDSLASGPTMPDSTTLSDCQSLLKKHGLLAQFPPAVRRLFESDALEETPKSDDPAFVRARWWPVLSNATAVKAAAEKMAASGFAVEIDNSCDDWDYARAADHLLSRLHEIRKSASRACLISGGEVTVKVSGKGGEGGRNQQFALYCAEHIVGENIAVLSAGTDGIDGNSHAAGAFVDGSTVQRAKDAGLNVSKALAAFDAYPLLNRLADAIVTGPTHNNVRDLRILLAY